jgi:hypothetical protein
MVEQGETYDVTWKVPFSAILAGPSRSGKSHFIKKLLLNMDVMYDKKPAYTIFYYASWQDTYDEMKEAGLVDEWRNEAPSTNYISEVAAKYENLGGVQVILDDLMSSCGTEMENLFTIFSHHHSISTIYVTQNLYQDSTSFRTMKLNATYLVLFKNPGNLKQAQTFFRSFRPRHATELGRIYETMTENGYTYMLIDLHQTTPHAIRIRTKIFPDEICEVYTPVR